jgi:hypothetical protein
MMRQRGRMRKTIKTAHSKMRWHFTSRKKLQRNHESKAIADMHDNRSLPPTPPQIPCVMRERTERAGRAAGQRHGRHQR